MVNKKITDLPAGSTAAGGAIEMVQTATSVQVTLGIMAYQAATAVAITGGTITGITDLAVADGGTGASTAAAAATNLGLGTGDSPQFLAVNIGAATDTTVERVSAGDISVEGNLIYRAGGTDVPVTDGGTGLSSATAYAVLCGGTTSTGAFQSIAGLGSAGNVLTSNGAGALPTFQASAASGANAALSNLASVAINTTLLPGANDGAALGSATLSFSDVFLATDGVINFNNGDVTITHAANQLDFSGAATAYTFNGGPVRPLANDGTALGVSGTAWSDLFLASGGVINFNAGDVTLTHNTDTLTVAGGGIVLAAGATAKAPLVMTSGTNLTTAAAGAVEFDGVSFYATSVASSRQVVNAEQISVLASDFTGTDVNTAQPIFSTLQDTLLLTASTTYEFEAFYYISRSAGTTSHTSGVLFGGTASFISIDYLAQVTNPTGNALANVQQIVASAATLVTLTAANTSATENIIIWLRGTMRLTAGGTIIPQFQFSAAPGGLPTFKRNSFFRCWPIGTNGVAAIGNWS